MFTRSLLNFLHTYPKALKVSANSNKIFIKFQNRDYSTTRNSETSTDVLIIGGGAMGASAAYWLKEKSIKVNKKIEVLVIEKDPTYQNCSTALSVGGIRQQFSVPENIQMSLFGASFLKNIKERFGLDADVGFMPNGYLLLASQEGAQQLITNWNLQQELGATNCLLNKSQLASRFPWLNLESVELGCLGGEKEGWFDPWALLTLMRGGAINKEAHFLQAEVVDFTFDENSQPKGVVVRPPGKKLQTINFVHCIIAAGAESGNVARLSKIGTGCENLSVALPVERRKRYVYRFDTQGDNAPPPQSPLTIDYTGVYFRRDGTSYITGLSPRPEEEPGTDNLDVDFDYFDRCVWPKLSTRIPAFESAKVKNAWGGFYEYNCFDANGIVGPHPCYPNIYFATGFSGHGIQQSPAAGLAVAELILDGSFRTIDLSRLGFNRIIIQKPVAEIGIF